MEIRLSKQKKEIIYLDVLMREIRSNSIICFKYNNNIFIIRIKENKYNLNKDIYQCISLNLKSCYYIPDTLENIIKYLLLLDHKVHLFNNNIDFSKWILNPEELETNKKPKILKEKHLRFLEDVFTNNKFNLYTLSPYFSDKFPDLTEEESNDIVQYWLGIFKMKEFKKELNNHFKMNLK